MRVDINPTVFLTYKAKDIQTKFAENPTCVDISESVESVRTKLDAHDFDQAPVTENGKVVGWILRKDLDAALSVSESFKMLHHNDLISAESPLNDLLQRLVDQNLIFIVGAEGIEGFAVQSDIERHVSRAHLYLLISGLEISIARILSRNVFDLDSIVPNMSVTSKEWWDKAKATDEEANPIEYLDLRGLGKALVSERKVLIHLGVSAEQWERYIAMLVNIRNWVAHSNTQEMRKYPFPIVVDHMKRTEFYIAKIISYRG